MDQFNPIDRLSRQPGGCQATPCALGDMEYIRTLSWNPIVIGYHVRIILTYTRLMNDLGYG